MGASEWVASGIAFGALAVAIIALVFSARSANASETSARASEKSAATVGQQHELDLAREGIVEFGPWHAEASGSLTWRFINVEDKTLYGLRLSGGGFLWDVGGAQDEVAPLEEATVHMPGGAQGPLAHLVTVFWREGSEDEPELSQVVRLRRRRPR